MITEQMRVEDILENFKPDTDRLRRYLPWLMEKSGKSVSNMYNSGDMGTHTVTFPVYDSNLLGFIKEVENSIYYNRNYPYVYTRNNLKTAEDELDFIQHITIQQIDQLTGIISHYVIGGRTKSRLWSEGITNGVICAAVSKAVEMVDYWVTML